MKKIKINKLFPLICAILISVSLPMRYVKAEDKTQGPFKLPDLPYSYNALEPYIDAKTMEIHYLKHHGAYVEKLNAAVNKYPELKGKTIEELLTSLDSLPDDIKETVRNNGGGHYNHSLFWTIMGKDKGREPKGELKVDIEKTFGSFENFKKEFKTSALDRFGSGWAWLIKDKDGKLQIISTANQDSPIMSGITPIMGLDVWEHAYYLKYQNKRAEYIDNWWNVVNWEEVQKRYES
ncbi:Superoxide dismutase [Clostridium vincentii]|uniref:Superoxide dismutase n=2 Tax=Clostridium vincentii TaxID=52704 RepID=A0A2T0BKG6_9CLOT|nr:superoxide dismutase [Clostridium vincentii]PRR84357.1 Superoxide dismutase [Clostridium vincentii]